MSPIFQHHTSPYLGFLHGEVTGPDHAEPGLLLQAALGVVVGHTGGDAHSAAPGARAPLCGLHQAVLLQVVQLWPVSWILPKNCAMRKRHKARLRALDKEWQLHGCFQLSLTFQEHQQRSGPSHEMLGLSAGRRCRCAGAISYIAWLQTGLLGHFRTQKLSRSTTEVSLCIGSG